MAEHWSIEKRRVGLLLCLANVLRLLLLLLLLLGVVGLLITELLSCRRGCSSSLPLGGERGLLHEAAVLPVLLVLGVVLLEVLLAAGGLVEVLTELLPEGLGERLGRCASWGC